MNQGIEASLAVGGINKTDLTLFQYKMFTKPTSATNMFSAVCVQSCPKKQETPLCYPNSENTVCPSPWYDTVAVYYYCLPEGDDVKDMLKAMYQSMNDKFNIGQYMADLQACWKGMAIMCVVTLVIAIVYIFLLKWITKPLLYVSMLLILVFFILLGGWCWIKRSQYDPENEKQNY